ncbi:MAG: GNAT family N-acetyltransferase [Thermaerobacter sp.]|nr:GNAT family N-acetyltransferase [Thermaerobacter sp.]
MRVILRDGRVADLREAVGSEEERAMLKEFFGHASPTAIYFRFFHALREVDDRKIAEMLKSARPDIYALLCVSGDELLGISHYIRTDESTAEVDFFVDERFHGYGIGTLLLEQMADVAWRSGLRVFEAYALQDNQKMINLLQHSGYSVKQHFTPGDYGTLRMVLPLGETERSRALREAREQMATAASLQPFLHPKTIAVVGASRDPSRLGHLLFRHVLESGFTGTAYPVNPSAHSVGGVRAYPSLAEVPEAIDLALLVVPAVQVQSVVDECIAAKVGGVAILSAGVAAGEEERREQDIAARLRAAGVRLLGPNCFGLLTTDPKSPLNASFAPALPRPGRLAIASQSGALGVAILDYASRIDVGVSSFVSMGDKTDVSGNDLLQYWEDDPSTDLIALYLESFGNPAKFSRIARRISPRKPILVVKSARTRGGAAISEYPGMEDPRDSTYEGLFQQTGIIRADTIEELFDVAALLVAGPLPKGSRVAVLTNSAGGAVITVDELPRRGLEIVRPPVDLGFEALPAGYRHALPEVLRDPSVDAVIVLFVPVGLSHGDEVAQSIADAVREVAEVDNIRKPIVANFLLTPQGGPAVGWIDAGEQRIPVYPFPERAVRALGKTVRYAEHHRQPRGRIPDLPGADPLQAREIIRAALQEQPSDLAPERAAEVLAAMGMAAASAPGPDEARLRVGIAQDPLFGPVLQVKPLTPWPSEPHERVVPLTDRDAEALAHICLRPFGEPVAAAQLALGDALLRLSRLVEEAPEVQEVSALLRASPQGVSSQDWTLRVAQIE